MTLKAFASDPDAVSPIIAVLLAVAMTVLLAGVVFVVVSGISGNKSQSAPTPVMTVDDVHDRLSVVAAVVGADWTRILVSATTCTTGGIINIGSSGASHQNQAASVANTYTAVSNSGCTGLNPKVQVAPSGVAIAAGDFLAFCTSGGTATAVTITMTDTVANVIVGSYTFTSIGPC